MHFIKYLINKFGSFISVHKHKIKVFILKNIHPNKKNKIVVRKINNIVGNLDLLNFQTKEEIKDHDVIRYHHKSFVIYEKEYIYFKNKIAFIKYFCIKDFFTRKAVIYKQVISEEELDNLSLPNKTDEDTISIKCFLRSIIGISYSSIGYSNDGGPTHVFLIPYVKGIKYNFFILCDSKLYQIIYIENVNELDFVLSLECIKRLDF